MVSRQGLHYDRSMIGLRFLPYPLLAAALLASAYAGLSGPAGAVSPSRPVSLAEFGNRVFFDSDSAELRPDAKEAIRRLAEWLNKNHPELNIMVEGHADERVSRQYAFDLGCRRAIAAGAEMIRHGFPAEQLGLVS